MSVPNDVAEWIRERAHKANHTYAAEMRLLMFKVKHWEREDDDSLRERPTEETSRG
jgi:hypothetical protein